MTISETVAAFAQDDRFPKNPLTVAYVVARLSNKELIGAPRCELVYVALLQRARLDCTVRVAGRVLPLSQQSINL